ncbi:MAG: haloacid dehalogenase-like hydrolase [Gammaproteobacteria bacterium]|nr:haloacid dehalogenase-like hydrolase [Gammaproteobacteria bacterium]
MFREKKGLLSLLFFLGLGFINSALAIDCSNYPHWDGSWGPGTKCSQHNAALVNIDNFIKANAGKGYVAAFDWDGTLYGEQIPLKAPSRLKGQTFSGDASWAIWAASTGKVFPAFKSDANALINNVLYTEGKTNAVLGSYSDFSHAATYETGMTPTTLKRSVNAYLNVYPARQWVFLPMMDIMQRLHDSGFKLWIITGSNPYYVATVLNSIEKNNRYRDKKRYDFGILPTSATAAPQCKAIRYSGCIAGNATTLAGGKFTAIYNDRFVAEKSRPALYYARYTIDGPGKVLVIQNYIQRVMAKPVILYAGNSGGDYQAFMYVLKRHLTSFDPTTKQYHLSGLTIAVQPQNESSFSALADIMVEHKSDSPIDIVKLSMVPRG